METPHRSAVHMGALLVLTRPFLREDQHTRVVQRLIEFVTATAGLSRGFGHQFLLGGPTCFLGDLETIHAIYLGGHVPGRVRAFIDHIAETLARSPLFRD